MGIEWEGEEHLHVRNKINLNYPCGPWRKLKDNELIGNDLYKVVLRLPKCGQSR